MYHLLLIISNYIQNKKARNFVSLTDPKQIVNKNENTESRFQSTQTASSANNGQAARSNSAFFSCQKSLY
jgi:hypothetical protein